MRHYRLLTALAICGAFLLITSCGSGDYDDTTATGTSSEATAARGPNEGGDAPIFWRTADDFASVVVGQPYTVLFRVTNGYDAETLDVMASCFVCGTPGQTQSVTFQGQNSPPFPEGSDLPGSYYPMNIVLPSDGQWQLFVGAGADEVNIVVVVAPAT